MTEAKWLACVSPAPMLQHLGGVSGRKLRLFAAACVARAAHLLTAQPRQAIRLAERFGEGAVAGARLVAKRRQLDAVVPGGAGQFLIALRRANRAAGRTGSEAELLAQARSFAWRAVRELLQVDHGAAARATPGEVEGALANERQAAVDPALPARMHVTLFRAARDAEQAVQAALLRDIFGNPFRPITFDPAWRTATVTSLAQAIYDERRFVDLPILADALEDAGCTSAAVLEHCRTPGEHVRGCWVVDLALEKE